MWTFEREFTSSLDLCDILFCDNWKSYVGGIHCIGIPEKQDLDTANSGPLITVIKNTVLDGDDSKVETDIYNSQPKCTRFFGVKVGMLFCFVFFLFEVHSQRVYFLFISQDNFLSYFQWLCCSCNFSCFKLNLLD